MAFPQDRLDIRVDFKFGGSTWTDVSQYVQVLDEQGGISITQGRSDWSGRVDPGSCTFRLDNRDGRFSPRNPLGPYYGSIGRNVPVRVSVMTGEVHLETTGGTDRARTPDAAAIDITGDTDIRVEAFFVDWHDGTEREIAGKYTPSDRGWLLAIADGRPRLYWSADGVTSLLDVATAAVAPPVSGRLAVRAALDVNNGAGGNTVTFYTAPAIEGPWEQLGDPVVRSGTTSVFNNSQPLEIGAVDLLALQDPIGRFYKFELRNGIDGTVVANPDFTAQTPGATSFADSAGRTWTLDGAASISNRNVRFVGEVPSWPMDQDTSGSDVYVEIEAAGIMRRMKSNQSGLQSTLRRRIPTYSPMAYWPMEEGSSAQYAASPIAGVSALRLSPANWAANETLVSSEALPEIDSSSTLCQMAGAVPAPASALAEWAVVWMYRDDTVNTTTYTFMRVESTGTARQWLLQWRDNQTTVLALDGDGATIISHTFVTGTDLYNQWIRALFWVYQDGSDVRYEMTWQDVGGDTGVASGSFTGTVGRPTKVASPTGGYAADLSGMAIGHISVWSAVNTALAAYTNAVTAWKGETAFERLDRVMDEEELPVTLLGYPDATHTVGEQRAQQLFEILQDAADVDGGILFEYREDLRLAYRDRASLYDQEPAITLAYDGDVMPGLKAQDDDQLTINDVTVTRTSAGSFRIEETEGPMAVSEYPDGVGRYPEEVTLKLASDSQTGDQAGWRLHMGTVDEPRWPVIRCWLQAATGQIPDVTGMIIGDRLKISDPPGKFQYDDIDVLVQGYTEFINQFRWEFEFNCTPASPWSVSYAGSDGAAADDERFSWADTSGTIIATAHTSTTTRLILATSTALPWTSDPFDSPYLLSVSGETVRVDSPGALLNSNPFFESGTTGWTAQNASIAASTAFVHPHPEATASVLVTPDGSLGAANCLHTLGIAVQASTRYVVSAWVYTPNGYDSTRVAVNWHDSGGGYLSTSSGTATVIPAGEWTFLSATVTAPASAATGYPMVGNTNSPTGSEVIYAWAVRLNRLKASEVYDEFGRTSTDTWGTSDSGVAWVNTGGAAADYDVLSGYGRHINPATSTGHHSTDGGGRGTVDLYCTLTAVAASTGASQLVGVLGRYTDINNLYEARLELATSGAWTLSIRKRVASVETQLGTFPTGLTFSSSPSVRVRFKLNGTDLRAKAWASTGREPSGWDIQVTDSSLSNGQTGVKSVRASGNTNANAEFRFDDFDMINRQEFTVTRSRNGVVKPLALGDDVRLRHPATVAL